MGQAQIVSDGGQKMGCKLKYQPEMMIAILEILSDKLLKLQRILQSRPVLTELTLKIFFHSASILAVQTTISTKQILPLCQLILQLSLFQNILIFFLLFFYNKIENTKSTMKNFMIFFGILTLLQTAVHKVITPTVMDQLLQITDQYFFLPFSIYKIPIKKFLRAAFHDCMKGCDASFNLYNTDNRGLEGLVAKYSQAYSPKSPHFQKIATYLTRADFLVLASERALAWGMKNGGKSPEFKNITPTFIYGRASNPNGIYNDDNQGELPDGRANWTLPSSDKDHPTTILQGLQGGLPGISQQDIVVLLGLHGTGGLNRNNYGFQGPWLQFANGTNIENLINNKYFIALFGINLTNSTMSQSPSKQNRFYVASERNYLSPVPDLDKIQWFTEGYSEGKVFLNADLSIYFDFLAASHGRAKGKYCPQRFNKTLFDCHKTDPTYLPLSKRAKQGFSYALDNDKYIRDLVPAFLRLVNVTNQFTYPSSLQIFYPQIICSNGVEVCMGDIFFTGCGRELHSCK